MEMGRQLGREFKLNVGVIRSQVAGLSHEDSLLQLPFRGNCLNWVLGHIVHSRQAILHLLAVEPLWDQAQYARYGRESEPIAVDEDVLPLSQILADLAASQEKILARLAEMDAADFENVPSGDERTVGEQVAFLSWHETYHTGQTEYLRQLAGTDDKII
jgi:uncharacterized damage-inducible protein DinB